MHYLSSICILSDETVIGRCLSGGRWGGTRNNVALQTKKVSTHCGIKYPLIISQVMMAACCSHGPAGSRGNSDDLDAGHLIRRGKSVKEKTQTTITHICHL